jgi:hypothetical protein
MAQQGPGSAASCGVTRHRVLATDNSQRSRSGLVSRAGTPASEASWSRRDWGMVSPRASAMTAATPGHRRAASMAQMRSAWPGGFTNSDARSRAGPPGPWAMATGYGQHSRPTQTIDPPGLCRRARPAR